MTGAQALATIFASLVALLVLAAAVTWRRVQPPEHDVPAQLDEVELAALNGGPQLAVLAAATKLRRSYVTHTPDNRLVANGPLADHAGELERELFDMVRRTPDSSANAILSSAADSETAWRIVERLEAVGLRLDDDAERRMLRVWMCGAVLVATGVAALAFFLSASDHDLSAIVAIGPLTVATGGVTYWVGSRQWGPTAAGRRLLKRVRADRGKDLRAAGGDLALAVAMFGSRALWETEPAYAAALGINAPAAFGINDDDAVRLGWERFQCC